MIYPSSGTHVEVTSLSNTISFEVAMQRALSILFICILSSAALAGSKSNNGNGMGNGGGSNNGNGNGNGQGNSSDPVLSWNSVAIDVLAQGGIPGPLFAARNMAIVQASVLLAVDALEIKKHCTDDRLLKDGSLQSAVAGAASTALTQLYPSQAAFVKAAVARLNGNSPESFALGAAIATKAVNARKNDGATNDGPYTAAPAPGVWQPTFPDFSPALGSLWGNVKPFVVRDPAKYISAAPPALTSPEYTSNVEEVRRLGRNVNSDRTADQTEIAIFWAYDILGRGSPIRIYNQALQNVSLKKRSSPRDNARLFAMANLAMADASITTWATKYEYQLWRPIQAIREANTVPASPIVGDPNWLPLGIPALDGTMTNRTPNFPSYVSGHAVFGAASLRIAELFYKTTQISFDLKSDELPGVTRHFDTLDEAAVENARSRVYLGVHYQFEADRGLELGRKVAKEVFSRIKEFEGN